MQISGNNVGRNKTETIALENTLSFLFCAKYNYVDKIRSDEA